MPVSHCCHFPGCLSVRLKAAPSQRACLLPVSPVESTNHRTKLRERAMRLLALVPIFRHVPPLTSTRALNSLLLCSYVSIAS